MTQTHPIASRVRPALAAALALAVVWPLASALAGPGPGKTPPPKPPTSAAATGSTLEEVEKASLQKRYEAVVAYARANPKAADAEETVKREIDLAESLEGWANVVAHADEFVAAFGSSKQKPEVIASKAGALGHLDKRADAIATYEAVTKDLKVDVNGPQLMFNIWSAYASYMADGDDADAARKVYEAFRAAFDGDPNQPAVARQIDGALKDLALIGTEPTAIPDTLKDMDGKAISLADYRGKVLMIDFWATWCHPCREEMPNVVAAYKKYHDKGFEILGISLDQEGGEKAIKEFTAKTGMPWRQYFDGKQFQNEIAQLYGVDGIPHTILIGKDGKIVKVGVRGPAVERALAKLLK